MIKSDLKISENAYISEESVIVGDVSIGAESSLFYYSVIRGDNAPIVIGKRTNIQEHCVLHVDAGHPMTVGDDVTVGHRVILHGCTIGNNVTIGMGSIVMNGAVIGDNCIIGAGSLVTQNKTIPAGSLVMGSPAKVIREVSQEQTEANRESAVHYAQRAAELFG